MPLKPPVHKQRTRTQTECRRDYDNTTRKNDPALARAKKIRSTARWQKVQRRVLRAWPLCCDPFGSHKKDKATVPSAQAHHVIGLREDPDLAFVLSNCRGICLPCHDAIEKLHRAGKPTQKYFIHV